MVMRFTGDVERIGPVDARQMTDWILAVPLENWPQQPPTPRGIKPAMTHGDWNGFPAQWAPIVNSIMEHFPGCMTYQQMLSVVMPGDDIYPHRDQQEARWITRVHVPLTTNDESKFIVDGKPHHLEAGIAYKVNTLAEHAVTNDGATPRIHFMFDVRTI
jgi:hypothetical protein